MMENELKISELAAIWNVSVPTTWNRVKKMGLKTFIKKNETNKDINYVSISDERIQEFIINVNNNVNNGVNNGYYEDMLRDDALVNNVNNEDANVIDVDYIKSNAPVLSELVTNVGKVYSGFSEQIITVNNARNEEVKNLYEEVKNLYEQLSDAKANQKLLTEQKDREGLYLQEIKDLKNENEHLNKDYNELQLNNNTLNNENKILSKDKEELLKKCTDIELINKKLDQRNKVKNAIIAVGMVILSIVITSFIMGNKQVKNVQPLTDTILQSDTSQAIPVNRKRR